MRRRPQGPLLREVLGHVEAAKVKISFTAVNGYTGWLTPDDIDLSDWILALEVNGVPLGIGQQGPLWLINTRAADSSRPIRMRRIGSGRCFICMSATIELEREGRGA